MILTHLPRGFENDDGYMRRHFMCYITSNPAEGALVLFCLMTVTALYTCADGHMF